MQVYVAMATAVVSQSGWQPPLPPWGQGGAGGGRVMSGEGPTMRWDFLLFVCTTEMTKTGDRNVFFFFFSFFFVLNDRESLRSTALQG